MKRYSLIIILIAVFIGICGCSSVNYGDSYSDYEELKEKMLEWGIDDILYPAYLGKESGKSKYDYVRANGSDGETAGYRIYHFGEKYIISVYGYIDDVSEFSLRSDLRAKEKEKITLDEKEVIINIGDIKKEEQFVICGLLIGGKQYEIRISGKTADTKIYYGNRNYDYAIEEIEKIIKSFS